MRGHAERAAVIGGQADQLVGQLAGEVDELSIGRSLLAGYQSYGLGPVLRVRG